VVFCGVVFDGWIVDDSGGGSKLGCESVCLGVWGRGLQGVIYNFLSVFVFQKG